MRNSHKMINYLILQRISHHNHDHHQEPARLRRRGSQLQYLEVEVLDCWENWGVSLRVEEWVGRDPHH